MDFGNINLKGTMLKQYVGGQTYNTVALNVTGFGDRSTPNNDVDRVVFVPYWLTDGSNKIWRLTFNITGTFDTGWSQPEITIAGITFKNTTNFYQSVVGCDISNGGYTTFFSRCNPNGGVILTYLSAATTRFLLSGDVELDSKPTWAD